jgi:hypothetical protein
MTISPLEVSPGDAIASVSLPSFSFAGQNESDISQEVLRAAFVSDGSHSRTRSGNPNRLPQIALWR